MERKIWLLKTFLFVLFFFFLLNSYAQQQTVPYFKGAIANNRSTEYRNIVSYSIDKNLSLSLTDATEEDWEDAFNGIELLQYKSPWVDNCMHVAFDSVEKRSVEFQRSLLELCYANYPNQFNEPISKLLKSTNDEKIFALCAEYLKQTDSSEKTRTYILTQLQAHDNLFGWNQTSNNASSILSNRFFQQTIISPPELLPQLFSKDYMKNTVVVYSIQRKNRDYPGIAIVRGTNGDFIKNNDGSIFYVAQLARSISNLPFYLTDGNTPQGIFRMYHFDVSGADFIGPTPNIQLTMPFETSIKHFLRDSTITDTAWTESLYKKLLPTALKDYLPLYETYYASHAGRTEIIAHGTTIDQKYYKGKPYYPQTPTEGCLCTEEIWSSIDGKRIISDQQQLVDAVKKAGGPNGYYIVIEIDDSQKPVSIEEILPFIK